MLTFQQSRFHDLKVAELYAVLRLRAEVFVVEQACAYQDVDGVDQRATHLLMTQADALVGYARWFAKDDATQIGRIVTAPTARGCGYGRRLVQECVSRIGAGPITMDAQTYLVDFYRSLGFSPVGAEFDEDGIPHIRMDRDCSARTGWGQKPHRT